MVSDTLKNFPIEVWDLGQEMYKNQNYSFN